MKFLQIKQIFKSIIVLFLLVFQSFFFVSQIKSFDWTGIILDPQKLYTEANSYRYLGLNGMTISDLSVNGDFNAVFLVRPGEIMRGQSNGIAQHFPTSPDTMVYINYLGYNSPFVFMVDGFNWVDRNGIQFFDRNTNPLFYFKKDAKMSTPYLRANSPVFVFNISDSMLSSASFHAGVYTVENTVSTVILKGTENMRVNSVYNLISTNSSSGVLPSRLHLSSLDPVENEILKYSNIEGISLDNKTYQAFKPIGVVTKNQISCSDGIYGLNVQLKLDDNSTGSNMVTPNAGTYIFGEGFNTCGGTTFAGTRVNGMFGVQSDGFIRFMNSNVSYINKGPRVVGDAGMAGVNYIYVDSTVSFDRVKFGEDYKKKGVAIYKSTATLNNTQLYNSKIDVLYNSRISLNKSFVNEIFVDKGVVELVDSNTVNNLYLGVSGSNFGFSVSGDPYSDSSQSNGSAILKGLNDRNKLTINNTLFLSNNAKINIDLGQDLSEKLRVLGGISLDGAFLAIEGKPSATIVLGGLANLKFGQTYNLIFSKRWFQDGADSSVATVKNINQLLRYINIDSGSLEVEKFFTCMSQDCINGVMLSIKRAEVNKILDNPNICTAPNTVLGLDAQIFGTATLYADKNYIFTETAGFSTCNSNIPTTALSTIRINGDIAHVSNGTIVFSGKNVVYRGFGASSAFKSAKANFIYNNTSTLGFENIIVDNSGKGWSFDRSTVSLSGSKVSGRFMEFVNATLKMSRSTISLTSDIEATPFSMLGGKIELYYDNNILSSAALNGTTIDLATYSNRLKVSGDLFLKNAIINVSLESSDSTAIDILKQPRLLVDGNISLVGTNTINISNSSAMKKGQYYGLIKGSGWFLGSGKLTSLESLLQFVSLRIADAPENIKPIFENGMLSLQLQNSNQELCQGNLYAGLNVISNSSKSHTFTDNYVFGQSITNCNQITQSTIWIDDSLSTVYDGTILFKNNEVSYLGNGKELESAKANFQYTDSKLHLNNIIVNNANRGWTFNNTRINLVNSTVSGGLFQLNNSNLYLNSGNINVSNGGNFVITSGMVDNAYSNRIAGNVSSTGTTFNFGTIGSNINKLEIAGDLTLSNAIINISLNPFGSSGATNNDLLAPRLKVLGNLKLGSGNVIKLSSVKNLAYNRLYGLIQANQWAVSKPFPAVWYVTQDVNELAISIQNNEGVVLEKVLENGLLSIRLGSGVINPVDPTNNEEIKCKVDGVDYYAGLNAQIEGSEKVSTNSNYIFGANFSGKCGSVSSSTVRVNGLDNVESLGTVAYNGSRVLYVSNLDNGNRRTLQSAKVNFEYTGGSLGLENIVVDNGIKNWTLSGTTVVMNNSLLKGGVYSMSGVSGVRSNLSINGSEIGSRVLLSEVNVSVVGNTKVGISGESILSGVGITGLSSVNKLEVLGDLRLRNARIDISVNDATERLKVLGRLILEGSNTLVINNAEGMTIGNSYGLIRAGSWYNSSNVAINSGNMLSNGLVIDSKGRLIVSEINGGLLSIRLGSGVINPVDPTNNEEIKCKVDGVDYYAGLNAQIEGSEKVSTNSNYIFGANFSGKCGSVSSSTVRVNGLDNVESLGTVAYNGSRVLYVSNLDNGNRRTLQSAKVNFEYTGGSLGLENIVVDNGIKNWTLSGTTVVMNNSLLKGGVYSMSGVSGVRSNLSINGSEIGSRVLLSEVNVSVVGNTKVGISGESILSGVGITGLSSVNKLEVLGDLRLRNARIDISVNDATERLKVLGRLILEGSNTLVINNAEGMTIGNSYGLIRAGSWYNSSNVAINSGNMLSNGLVIDSKGRLIVSEINGGLLSIRLGSGVINPVDPTNNEEIKCKVDGVDYYAGLNAQIEGSEKVSTNSNYIFGANFSGKCGSVSSSTVRVNGLDNVESLGTVAYNGSRVLYVSNLDNGNRRTLQSAKVNFEYTGGSLGLENIVVDNGIKNWTLSGTTVVMNNSLLKGGVYSMSGVSGVRSNLSINGSEIGSRVLLSEVNVSVVGNTKVGISGESILSGVGITGLSSVNKLEVLGDLRLRNARIDISVNDATERLKVLGRLILEGSNTLVINNAEGMTIGNSYGLIRAGSWYNSSNVAINSGNMLSNGLVIDSKGRLIVSEINGGLLSIRLGSGVINPVDPTNNEEIKCKVDGVDYYAGLNAQIEGSEKVSTNSNYIFGANFSGKCGSVSSSTVRVNGLDNVESLGTVAYNGSRVLYVSNLDNGNRRTLQSAKVNFEYTGGSLGLENIVVDNGIKNWTLSGTTVVMNNSLLKGGVYSMSGVSGVRSNLSINGSEIGSRVLLSEVNVSVVGNTKVGISGESILSGVGITGLSSVNKLEVLGDLRLRNARIDISVNDATERLKVLGRLILEGSNTLVINNAEGMTIGNSYGLIRAGSWYNSSNVAINSGNMLSNGLVIDSKGRLIVSEINGGLLSIRLGSGVINPVDPTNNEEIKCKVDGVDYYAGLNAQIEGSEKVSTNSNYIFGANFSGKCGSVSSSTVRVNGLDNVESLGTVAYNGSRVLYVSNLDNGNRRTLQSAKVNFEYTGGSLGLENIVVDNGIKNWTLSGTTVVMNNSLLKGGVYSMSGVSGVRSNLSINGSEIGSRVLLSEVNVSVVGNTKVGISGESILSGVGITGLSSVNKLEVLGDLRLRNARIDISVNDATERLKVLGRLILEGSNTLVINNAEGMTIGNSYGLIRAGSWYNSSNVAINSGNMLSNGLVIDSKGRLIVSEINGGLLSIRLGSGVINPVDPTDICKVDGVDYNLGLNLQIANNNDILIENKSYLFGFSSAFTGCSPSKNNYTILINDKDNVSKPNNVFFVDSNVRFVGNTKSTENTEDILKFSSAKYTFTRGKFFATNIYLQPKSTNDSGNLALTSYDTNSDWVFNDNNQSVIENSGLKLKSLSFVDSVSTINNSNLSINDRLVVNNSNVFIGGLNTTTNKVNVSVVELTNQADITLSSDTTSMVSLYTLSAVNSKMTLNNVQLRVNNTKTTENNDILLSNAVINLSSKSRIESIGDITLHNARLKMEINNIDNLGKIYTERQGTINIGRNNKIEITNSSEIQSGNYVLLSAGNIKVLRDIDLTVDSSTPIALLKDYLDVYSSKGSALIISANRNTREGRTRIYLRADENADIVNNDNTLPDTNLEDIAKTDEVKPSAELNNSIDIIEESAVKFVESVKEDNSKRYSTIEKSLQVINYNLNMSLNNSIQSRLLNRNMALVNNSNRSTPNLQNRKSFANSQVKLPRSSKNDIDVYVDFYNVNGSDNGDRLYTVNTTNFLVGLDKGISINKNSKLLVGGFMNYNQGNLNVKTDSLVSHSDGLDNGQKGTVKTYTAGLYSLYNYRSFIVSAVSTYSKNETSVNIDNLPTDRESGITSTEEREQKNLASTMVNTTLSLSYNLNTFNNKLVLKPITGVQHIYVGSYNLQKGNSPVEGMNIVRNFVGLATLSTLTTKLDFSLEGRVSVSVLKDKEASYVNLQSKDKVSVQTSTLGFVAGAGLLYKISPRTVVSLQNNFMKEGTFVSNTMNIGFKMQF